MYESSIAEAEGYIINLAGGALSKYSFLFLPLGSYTDLSGPLNTPLLPTQPHGIMPH